MSKLLPFLLAASLAAQTPNSLSTAEQRQGWKLLFDGRSGAGWQLPTGGPFPQPFWSIDDGWLRGNPIDNRAVDLMTAAKFHDFDLCFEWKISAGGNSGLKYLVGAAQKLVFLNGAPLGLEGQVNEVPPGAEFRESAAGLEYQIVDEERHSDGKTQTTRSGALYQFIGPTLSAMKPAGEINDSRILVKGNHVEHWLNGKQIVSVAFDSPDFKATAEKVSPRIRRTLAYINQEGAVALQCHTGAVWFRNIKIRAPR